jgi:hypothetical protein
MKKLYIVQPMNGLTTEEIEKIRQHAWDYAEHETGENMSPLPTYTPDAEGEPLELLGRALQQMAKADYVIFVPYYGLFRGCRIEQMAAENYEKRCIYMKE